MNGPAASREKFIIALDYETPREADAEMGATVDGDHADDLAEPRDLSRMPTQYSMTITGDCIAPPNALASKFKTDAPSQARLTKPGRRVHFEVDGSFRGSKGNTVR
jgi:hypothetical protein